MTVSKGVGKKIITKVKHCTTRPLLGCYSPKLRQQMDTSANISKWNYTTNVITFPILCRRDRVQEVIGIR